MALPNYPPTLPYRPQQAGTGVKQLFTPPVKSEVEEGPPILREWSSSNWTSLDYRMLYTHAEYEIFEDFLMVTLKRGRQRFYMPVGKFGNPNWTPKVCYIEPDTLKGPIPAGEGHVTVDFVLNVNGWTA